jgi:TolA-binding protein
MIDPPRLREGGSEAPSELKDLFLAAKKPEPLTPATDARLTAQVTALAALPATPLLKGLPWLIAGGAVVVAGAFGLVAERAPAPGPAPNSAATASSPPAVTVDPVTPAASTPELQAPAEKPRAPATSAGHAAPAEAASSSEDALAGEAQLLNQAHAAMAGDPRKAHAFASTHAKRYPRGQLAAERELILVQALVKLGRVSEAEARGRALRKSAPSSIYSERLDAILKGQ